MPAIFSLSNQSHLMGACYRTHLNRTRSVSAPAFMIDYCVLGDLIRWFYLIEHYMFVELPTANTNPGLLKFEN